VLYLVDGEPSYHAANARCQDLITTDTKISRRAQLTARLATIRHRIHDATSNVSRFLINKDCSEIPTMSWSSPEGPTAL